MVQEYFSLSFKLILILGEIEQYQSEGEKKPCKFPIRWKFRKVLWYKMVSYSSINVLKFSILISSYRTRLRKEAVLRQDRVKFFSTSSCNRKYPYEVLCMFVVNENLVLLLSYGQFHPI